MILRKLYATEEVFGNLLLCQNRLSIISETKEQPHKVFVSGIYAEHFFFIHVFYFLTALHSPFFRIYNFFSFLQHYVQAPNLPTIFIGDSNARHINKFSANCSTLSLPGLSCFSVKHNYPSIQNCIAKALG